MSNPMMWALLTPQGELDAQWEAILSNRSSTSLESAAMALARYAEARVYAKAMMAIELLQEELEAAREQGAA